MFRQIIPCKLHSRQFPHALDTTWTRSFRSSAALEKSVTITSNSGVVKNLKAHLIPEVYPSSPSPAASTSSASTPSTANPVKTLIRSETLFLQDALITKKKSGNTESGSKKNLALVDGPKGVGKSTLLQQIVSDARGSGYVVLYVPNSREWVDGPGFFAPVVTADGDLVRDGLSVVRYYDRPKQVEDALRSLVVAHAEQLQEIPYTGTGTEENADCKTLLALVEKGISLLSDIDSNWRVIPSHATDVFHEVITQLCAQTTVNFALIVDDFHTLLGPSCMKNSRNQVLHANAVRTVSEFLGRESIQHTAESIRNDGFVLLASEARPPFIKAYTKSSRILSTLDYPLSDDVKFDISGEKWYKQLRKKLKATDEKNKHGLYINLPECNPNELKAMSATFSSNSQINGIRFNHNQSLDRSADGIEAGTINSASNSRNENERLIMLAGGNGKQMNRIFNIR